MQVCGSNCYWQFSIWVWVTSWATPKTWWSICVTGYIKNCFKEFSPSGIPSVSPTAVTVFFLRLCSTRCKTSTRSSQHQVVGWTFLMTWGKWDSCWFRSVVLTADTQETVVLWRDVHILCGEIGQKQTFSVEVAKAVLWRVFTGFSLIISLSPPLSVSGVVVVPACDLGSPGSVEKAFDVLANGCCRVGAHAPLRVCKWPLGGNKSDKTEMKLSRLSWLPLQENLLRLFFVCLGTTAVGKGRWVGG